MKLYYFNYSHELALANGHINYYPPYNVRRMETDLMPLAAWLAQRGDSVVVEKGTEEVCYDFFKEKKPDVAFCAISQLPPHFDFCPWGLNAHLCWMFQKNDVYLNFGEKRIEAIRELASRRTACDLLLQLVVEGGRDSFCGESRFCESEASIKDALQTFPSAILKAPWSSSGRGLRFGKGQYVHPLAGWCRHTLETQGGVVVEPFYTKVRDFAVEFEALANGQVNFLGLSSFQTTPRCSYIGNRVATQELLRQEIFRELSVECFDKMIPLLEQKLGATLGGRYKGPLGVDMMVCREGNTLKIHPCVEINLRQTMGHVAMSLSRVINPKKMAQFSIRFEHSSAKLQQFVQQLQTPTFDDENRLVSGCLPLVPLTSESQYVAWLEVL